MAGALRRMGEYLGLVEQPEYDDYETESVAAAPQLSVARAVPHAVVPIGEHRAPAGVSDVPRIEKMTPRTYNDALPIGEAFRDGVPVIMNLSDIDDDDAKRLVDFAAGLVFAARGSLNRITAKVFLLSPNGVHVTDEDKAVLASSGFYNQS